MRRIVTLLLVATVVLIMVAAGVVVAVNKLWNSFPCRGTDNNDQLHEQIGIHKKDRSWASRAANLSTQTTMGGTGIGWRRLLTNDTMTVATLRGAAGATTRA